MGSNPGKVFSVTAVFILFIFSVFAQSVKTDIDLGKIPLPPGSRALEIPLPKVGNSSADTVYYKTVLDTRKLISFYTKELSRRGWENKENALEAIKKINVPFDKQYKGVDVEGLLKNMIYFYKNEQTLMLMIIPPRGRHTETIFTLSYIGGAFFNQGSSQSQSSELPSSIPIYPQAEFMSRVLKTRIYTIGNKGINEVINFYKQKMPVSGWILQNETPITEEIIDTSSAFDNESNCKTCPKPKTISLQVINELKKGISILKSELYFTNGMGEKCKLQFSKMQSIALPSPTQLTIIYDKGRK